MEQLPWVVLAQGFSWSCGQDDLWRCGHLKAWQVQRSHLPKWSLARLLEMASVPCWRLIRDLSLSPGQPLHKAVGMSSQYISCFPPQWPKEEQGRSHSVCHYLVSDVRHSHFWHILFFRSNSLTQPTLKRRGISLQYLKGRISPDWWTYLQDTTIGLGGHLLYLTLKYSVSIPHGCCQKIRGFE